MTYRRRTPAASEGTRALARSPSRRRHALETRDAVLPAPRPRGRWRTASQAQET